MAGYDTQIGNPRNGTAHAWPTVWRTADYEYCIVTKQNWDLLVCQRLRAGGPWTTYNVSSVGTPGTGPRLGVSEAGFEADGIFGKIYRPDSHQAAAMAVDAKGYIHISGNTHQEPMRYIKSKRPHDITEWVQGPNPTTWLSSGENITTYQAYQVFSDGTLLWHQDQSDFPLPGRSVIGRDQTMWRLSINDIDSSGVPAWKPCVGTGEIMLTPNPPGNQPYNEATGFDDGIPDRSYLFHSYVDINDVLHCVYAWRKREGDETSMDEHFYVRSKDKGSTWENVLGEPLDAPFEYRKVLDGVNGVGAAAIKVQGISIGGATSGGRCIDKAGNFHFVVVGSGTNTYANSPTIIPPRYTRDAQNNLVLQASSSHNHVWWDGSAWQIKELYGYSSPTGETLSMLNGELWLWNYSNNDTDKGFYGTNIGLRDSVNSRFHIRIGNCPGPNAPDEPDAQVFKSGAVYHPALTHAGGYENNRYVTVFSIPDGDDPRVVSVGDGPRYRPKPP